MSKYGFHRVIVPKGVVPQAAWKVDNRPIQLHKSEKLVKVKILNLDSTSMRQLTSDDNSDVGQKVWNIVQERGKMHNPITNSGGVLLGEYNGQAIVPWPSLSALPLHLDKIKSISGQQIDVEGTAIMFESYYYTPVPEGMDWRLAVTALDIASLTVQVKRVVQEKNIKNALVIGCGNAGIAAMATIKKYSPQSQIYGIDVSNINFDKIKKFDFTKNLALIDAVNSEAVVNFVSNCDLVVNCVNIQDTEATSVLTARDEGIVIFFSMATRFDKASLATDATGRDVTMIVASGIAKGEDVEILQLIKDFPNLLSVSHAQISQLVT